MHACTCFCHVLHHSAAYSIPIFNFVSFPHFSAPLYLKGVWLLSCEWGFPCTVICETEAPSRLCLPRWWQSTQTNLLWSMRLQERWGQGNKFTVPNISHIAVLTYRTSTYPLYSRFGVSGSCRSDAMPWLTGRWRRDGLREMWWPCTWRAGLQWWLCGWGWLWWVSRLHSSTTTFDSNHCCTVSACLVLGQWCSGRRWEKVGTYGKDRDIVESAVEWSLIHSWTVD